MLFYPRVLHTISLAKGTRRLKNKLAEQSIIVSRRV